MFFKLLLNSSFFEKRLDKYKKRQLEEIRKEQEKFEIKCSEKVSVMNNLIHEYIFLIKNGFEYSDKENFFVKTEKIDYGKYPGSYKIEVVIPKEYPNKPPKIYCHPLYNLKNYSGHILDSHLVCIASYGRERPSSYWKKTMNVKTALLLAYQVITGELEKVMIFKRNNITIKGTVFEDLKNIISTNEFLNHFKSDLDFEPLTKNEKPYTWEEVAYLCKDKPMNLKKRIINFYNSKKKG